MSRPLTLAKLAAISLTISIACGTSRERSNPGFSGQAALDYVRTQLDFGPRAPGTASHQRAGDWIRDEMRRRADTVIVQGWTHITTRGDTLPLRNILARFRPTVRERVLYITHWDTRPTADREADPEKRQRPIPGANDGASGVALLLALADAFTRTRPSVGVDLLFVDGEDYGDFADPDLRDVLIGSRYFANHLPEPGYTPLYGVVWDMIGAKNLRILQDEYSAQAAPEVVELVWQMAEALGYGDIFLRRTRPPVIDDHIPLLKAGLRVIDVIDLDYTTDTGQNLHHTLEDTIDKLSKSSFQVVGDVAMGLVTKR